LIDPAPAQALTGIAVLIGAVSLTALFSGERWVKERISIVATKGTVQIERKSIAELTTARSGTRQLPLEEGAELVGPSLLEVYILL
jgi:hypothetical protein